MFKIKSNLKLNILLHVTQILLNIFLTYICFINKNLTSLLIPIIIKTYEN